MSNHNNWAPQEQNCRNNRYKNKNFHTTSQNSGNRYYSDNRRDFSGNSNVYNHPLNYGNAWPYQNYNNIYNNYYEGPNIPYRNMSTNNSWRYSQVNVNRRAVTYENFSESHTNKTNFDGHSKLIPEMRTDEKKEILNENDTPSCSTNTTTDLPENNSSVPVDRKVRGGFKQEEKLRKQTLMKALSQPIESSKAERMMEKMGWRGGALGVSGNGLMEPIAPDLSQIKRSGFGLATEKKKPRTQQKPMEITAIYLPVVFSLPADKKINTPKGRNNKRKGGRPKVPKPPKHVRILRRLLNRKKDFTKCGVLERILEFVKDDTVSCMEFEATLSNVDRKLIHNLVEVIRDVEGDKIFCSLDLMPDLDFVKEIWSYNRYVLNTQSNGTPPNRKLSIYKEAPEHVYLITKDDLDLNYADQEHSPAGVNIGEKHNDENFIIIDDDDITDEINYDDKSATETNSFNDKKGIENIGIEVSNNLMEYNDDNGFVVVDDDDVRDENNYDDKSATETNSFNDKKSIENIGIEVSNNLTAKNHDNGFFVVDDDDARDEKSCDKSVTETNSNDDERTYENIENNDGVDIGSTTAESDIENETVDSDIKNKTQQNINVKNGIKKEYIKNSPSDRITLEDLKELLIKYFKEFVDDKKCTQIRFLGDFDEIESNAIAGFTEYVKKCTEDIENIEDNSLKDIFLSEEYQFSVNLDENEHTVIEKNVKKTGALNG